MAAIELENITVKFGRGKKDIIAVDDVSLTIEKGDIYGIIGYSGAGKSTLVRNINLLQNPTSGRVKIDGQLIFDGKTLIAPKALRELRQGIGMIFQHFNLLSEKTVSDNVAFALRHSSLDKASRQAKVAELLELVDLTELANSYPAQLSGGQKQRVAIARALANDPKILLSDEGTSALDPKTTNQILDLLKSLHEKLGLTIVLITHEMQVVKEIANKIAVMQDGKVIESGSLLDIFGQPQADLTKQFIATTSSATRFVENIEKTSVLSNLAPDEELIHLTYGGNTLENPIVSDISKKFDVTTNIYFGDVELLQGQPFGSLIIVLKGATDARQAVKSYLQENNVSFELLSKEAKTND